MQISYCSRKKKQTLKTRKVRSLHIKHISLLFYAYSELNEFDKSLLLNLAIDFLKEVFFSCPLGNERKDTCGQ